MHAAEEPLATRRGARWPSPAHPKFVGIGETGLDYHYTADTAGRQRESLRVHIEAARRTGLPLIVHARDADADIGAHPRRRARRRRLRLRDALLHRLGARSPRRRSALGFYLSISGIATFRNADDLRAVFAAAPRDRLLVETDSPYLAPAAAPRQAQRAGLRRRHRPRHRAERSA